MGYSTLLAISLLFSTVHLSKLPTYSADTNICKTLLRPIDSLAEPVKSSAGRAMVVLCNIEDVETSLCHGMVAFQ